MPHFLKSLAKIILSILLIFLVASCVPEDVEDRVQYALNVRAVDADGNDLTNTGVLEQTAVYLFNKNGFARMVPTGTSSDYLFGAEKSDTLTLVAWGNIKSDALTTTQITPGTSIEDACLQLRQQGEGNNIPVTDLFYSRKSLTESDAKSTIITSRGAQESTVTLVMSRRAASISIRTRYFAVRYPYTETAYRLVVRGTGNTIDFDGKLTGDEAHYEPTSITNSIGDIYAPPFQIFSTNKGAKIEIDIYRGNEKLYTISEDNELKTLYAPAGKQLNVDIDFRNTKINVMVTIVAWGEVSQQTEI